jgi:hypothetical protein
MTEARLSRKFMREREIAERLQGTFRAEGSRGWQLIEHIANGERLGRMDIWKLATVFSIVSGIRFPRNMTRRRNLIVKWFDEHADELLVYTFVIRFTIGNN